jgi:hypothetical protein
MPQNSYEIDTNWPNTNSRRLLLGLKYSNFEVGMIPQPEVQSARVEVFVNLKNLALALNILLLMLCAGFFIGHGTPKSLTLWSSAILWALAPLVNIFYILRR